MSNTENKNTMSNTENKNTLLSKRGYMKYRTCFSSVSFHGYKLDLLKSGVQKYLRRGEYEKMIWCALEIWRFEQEAKTELEHKMSKGIISNLINRLIIMMDEELLFCECARYYEIKSLIERFDFNRKGGINFLIMACKCLVEGRLLRRNSDIRGFWNRRFEDKTDEDKTDEDKTDEDKTDEFYFEKFVECFEKEDSKMYYWMFKIFDGKRKGEKRRFRRKENIYMIWEYLFGLKNIKENKVYAACLEYRLKEFYKLNRTERVIFLTSSIDIARYCRDSNEKSLNSLNELHSFYENAVKSFNPADFLRKRDEYMQIDDYAIDMHTIMGRKMGKTKKDFILEGAVIVNEDTEFLEKEWRKFYNDYGMNCDKGLTPKKKKNKKKVVDAVVVDAAVVDAVVVDAVVVDAAVVDAIKKKQKTDRATARSEKNKRIKKMRGKPKFDDLEKDILLRYGMTDVNGKKLFEDNIKLCGEKTCGNKVMCFEYNGKIYKESRKSMNYNRDYICFDECKELFGLKKIGMMRMLGNFKIVRKDKDKKDWTDNWKMEYIDIKKEQPIVYCVMNKVGVHKDSGEIKRFVLSDRKYLKQFAKIGAVRGIFRVSDFNTRNVMLDGEGDFVSIDEGEIGTRLDIIGGRESWLISALNKDKTIMNEVMKEIHDSATVFENCGLAEDIMRKYKFSNELIYEVANNLDNLRADLKSEGIEFD